MKLRKDYILIIFGIFLRWLWVVNSTSINARIVNGQRAIENELPYLVALKFSDYSFFEIFRNYWRCTGSIISNTWILTAAHCVRNAYKVEVTFGSLNRNDGNTLFVQSEDIILHPKFQSNNHKYPFDIALLKTPNIHFTESVQYIRLPSMYFKNQTFKDRACLIAGWGGTSQDTKGPGSEYLIFAQMKVISNFQCSLRANITENAICAIPINGGSICRGDSGGPLITMNRYQAGIQIGVASQGGVRCERGYLAVFERLTSSLDWIEEVSGVVYR